jgi:putative DNA primase/helicase
MRHDPNPLREKSRQTGGTRRRPSKGTIVATYDYTDEQGTVLSRAVRYQPKGFSQERPDGHGGWIPNMDGVRRVPYRLPEFLAAIQAGRRIVIPEGEKDVGRLIDLGHAATCNAMGAGKWPEDFARYFEGATSVVVLADHDPDGDRHATQVCANLWSVVPKIQRHDFTDLRKGGDVSNWLDDAGHTPEALETLLTHATVVTTKPTSSSTTVPQGRPVVVTMSDVDREAIEWLWWPYIAVGKLCMLDGDPGIGKSLLMTQVAASLSQGQPLPDQQGKPTLAPDSPQETLLRTAEDGLGDTLKPRLEAAGADCTKIHVLTGWRGSEDQDEMFYFTLQHLWVLEDALKQYQPRLVVLDPIQAYVGDIDMHRANETRPLLAALARLAEQYHCAIVCIRHPSKPGQALGKMIHRGLGSIDFIGAARTGLYVEQHPVDVNKVLLLHIKSNIGPRGRTQVYAKANGLFQWCAASRLTVELLEGSGRGPDPRVSLEVFCWLETHMTPGVARPATATSTPQEAPR